MPINSSGQGFSENTLIKQKQFRKFVDVHLRICQVIFDKYQSNYWLSHKYHYIDLNAGPGITNEYGVGSPIIFLQESVNHKVDSRCHFVDLESSALQELEKNIEQFPCEAKYFPCANHLAIQNISDILHTYSRNNKKRLYGLIYSDENGSVPPFDELAKAFKHKHLESIDILIYFSATNVKRCLKSDSADRFKRLTEYICSVPKKHWQIRKAYVGDKHQWSFLFGTNWMGYPEMKELDLYDIKTKKGQSILESLTYTNKELENIAQLEIDLDI
jgi:three-Cys-motif partner protein